MTEAGDGPHAETAPLEPSPAAAGDARKWYEKKRTLLPIVAIVAFFLGIGAGASDEVTTTDDERVAELEEEVAELEEELDAVREERDTWQERAEEREEEVEELREALASAAEEAGEAEPEPEPEPPADPPADPEAETYTAGQYTFADVQVREDFVGDFEVRARVTNTGRSRDSVGLRVSIFREGSVVGTAQAAINDFGEGETRTVEMFSTDDYTDWDAVEFQVEYQF